MFEFIERTEERIEERIENRFERVGGAIKGRLSKVITAFVAFVSTLLVGPLSLVEPIMSAPGAAWAFVTGLPGMVAGVAVGAATTAVSVGAGLLSSWGLGFIATGMAFVAGRPIAGVGLLALVGVGATGFMDLNDEIRFLLRAVLVAVVGFVAAIVFGPALVGGGL